MRVFKTKWFARFARHEGIGAGSLREAIERAKPGLIDADLGGGLIKQRVARQGKGKSGGYRTLIAYRANDRAVFLFGFAKSDRGNIGPHQIMSIRALGNRWLDADVKGIALGIQEGEIQEVANGEEDEQIN